MKKYKVRFGMGIIIACTYVFIIWVLGYRFDNLMLLPDKGASWYYWKLPQKEFMPLFTAWAFYFLHQITVWALIFKAQFGDKRKLKSTISMMITANIFFVGLHILQTHLWYDGLAQDMPIFTSQGSVIVMLVLILAMEVKRRGLFLGKKIEKLPFIGDITSPIKFIKKYHGYVFSWAVVYTFWFHPTVSTSGHLIGFLYLFLLFIQMSFMYTSIHKNRYWTFILEIMVLFHGTMVAINQGNNMWPMFLFGFATLVVITQLYGLKMKKWMLRGIQIVYIVGVIIVFGGFTGHREFYEIHQILWIPIIEYLLVFVFIYSIAIIQKIKK